MEAQQQKIVVAPLGAVKDHPAQMRTVVDPLEMAKLTLQVFERGLDSHNPIVVSDNQDGTFTSVSGHRRKLARLLAEEVRVRVDGTGADVDLDFVCQVVFELASRPAEVEVCANCGEVLEESRGTEAWCPRCENYVGVEVQERDVPSPCGLLDAQSVLEARHGHVEAPLLIFEGSKKEEILLLQAANFGQEVPDLLGQAKSYAAALEHGATVEEIAANTGQPVSRVEAVLSLNEVPEELARAVAAGEVALGAAAQVARLDHEAQRQAMAQYVLEGSCTVDHVREVVSALCKWEAPAVRLDPDQTPQERNSSRLLAAVWAKVLAEDPVRAWYAALRGIKYGRFQLRHFGLEGSASEWLYQLVPDARCERCQLRESLKAAPKLRYINYPCQQEVEDPGVCMRGVFEGDPFFVEVSWTWEDYPGVQTLSRHTHACLSPDDFRQASEAAIAEAEKQDEDEEEATAYSSYEYTPGPARVKLANVAQQRALIRAFMEQHTEMSGASHPLATRCEQCKWKLASSPTKNPDVPHCQWAARRRNVEFLVREPVEGEGPEIPLCRQYGPTRSWDDAIPDHPAPPGVPRAWMVDTIRQMVTVTERRDCGLVARRACELLTGRPLASKDSNRGWFIEGLDAEIGNLSDGQLWSLAMWVTADWVRSHRNKYLLPLPDGRVIEYRERRFQPPPAEADEAETCEVGAADETTAEAAQAEEA